MSNNPLDEVVNSEGATTLDRVLAQAPSKVQDSEIDFVIAGLRTKRGLFVKADAEKAAKREGAEGEDFDYGQEQQGTD